MSKISCAGPSGGDDPWASKTSIHALLNADLPMPKRSRPAEPEEEDPMVVMKRQKKLEKVHFATPFATFPALSHWHFCFVRSAFRISS